MKDWILGQLPNGQIVARCPVCGKTKVFASKNEVKLPENCAGCDEPLNEELVPVEKMEGFDVEVIWRERHRTTVRVYGADGEDAKAAACTMLQNGALDLPETGETFDEVIDGPEVSDVQPASAEEKTSGGDVPQKLTAARKALEPLRGVKRAFDLAGLDLADLVGFEGDFGTLISHLEAVIEGPELPQVGDTVLYDPCEGCDGEEFEVSLRVDGLVKNNRLVEIHNIWTPDRTCVGCQKHIHQKP